MGLLEFFVRKPVFASVVSLMIVLLGLVSFSRLSLREYPNIDPPVVSVRTDYPGASAQIIESQVTQVLEGSIAGIGGVEILESRSRPESSRITVRFLLSVDPDEAANDVRDRVSRVRGRLPDEVSEPVVSKVEADAQSIIFIALTSDRKHPHRGVRLRRPLHQGPVAEPAGRCRGAHLRRAPRRDAGVGRPHEAGRLRPDRPGCRACPAPAECRGALGADREFRPRVHGAFAHRADHQRAVPPGSSSRTRTASPSASATSRGWRWGRRTSAGRHATRATMRSSWAWVKQATANPLDVSGAMNEAMPDIRRGPAGRHERRHRL